MQGGIMKTKNILTVILFFIGGCTTVEFVSKEVTPTRQATLRHLTPSSNTSYVDYRDKVNKKASEFCEGDFEITNEYQALEESNSSTRASSIGLGSGTIFAGGAHRGPTTYNMVEVACR
jgi:hypothetical protein